MNAMLFLINTLIDLYLYVLAARLLLAYSHADWFHPFTQLIIRLTQPLILPIKRFMANFRGIETATLFWIVLIVFLKLLLIFSLVDSFPAIYFLLILTLSGTVKIILQTLFYAILIHAIMSWVSPYGSPAASLFEKMTAPLMRPLRRIIPPIAGIDITPIPALILLQFFILLLP